MKPHKSRFYTSTLKFLTFSMLGAVAMASVHSASAASATWSATAASGAWSNVNNWVGPPASVPGIDDTATFNSGSSTTTIDVAGQTVKSIVFDTASAAAYTIGTGAAGDQTINMDSSNTNLSISLASSVTVDQVFNAHVVATDNQKSIFVSNLAPGRSLTFNGNFVDKTFGTLTAAPGAIINMLGTANEANNGAFRGGGTLNTNSTTNGKYFTNDWGIVNYNATRAMSTLTLGAAAAGNGDAIFNIKNTSGPNIVTVNTILGYTADDNTANLGIINGDATTSLAFSSAEINAQDNLLVSGAELTINANIDASSTGTGGGITPIQLKGAGTVAINGTDSHTTGWDVQLGTLLFNGTSTSGPVTVGAAGTLGGTGTIGGNVTIAEGGGLKFALSSAPGSHDKLEVGGTFAFPVNSTLTITNPGGATTGVYTLVTSAGLMNGSVPTVVLPPGWTADAPVISGTGPFNLTINITNVAAPPASITWNNGTANNTWDIATSANWIGGDTKFHNGDTVTFDGTIAAGTITLASNVSPKSVYISNIVNPFQFDANKITFATVLASTNDAAVTINSQLAGAGAVTKSGAGLLTLTGANLYSGGTTITASTLRTGTVTSLGSGDVTLEGTQARLEFAGAAGGTVINNFTLTAGGNNKELKFDLDGAGTAITLSGAITLNKPESYRNEFQTGDDAVTISGLISGIGGMEKQDGGTLTLTNNANSFGTHAVGEESHIFGGTLEVTSIGNKTVPSAAGAGVGFEIGSGGVSGTLSYIGASDTSTDRYIIIGGNLGIGGAKVVTTAGTGALTFTAAAFNVAANNVTLQKRNLTLGGTNTGANEIQGVIIDNTGATPAENNAISVIKEGAGTWSLTGTNTYTGTTTVTGGVLVVDGDAIPNTGSLILDGGTLTATSPETVDTFFIGATQQPYGTYINTAGITGTLIVNNGPAPTSGYSTWITGPFANGTVPEGQRGPNDDWDNDGTNNLLEYALAGFDPTVGNGATASIAGSLVTYTKRAPLATDITYSIEESTDLGISDVWATATPTTNNGSVITYTLTAPAPTKDFVRLKVSQN